MFGCPLLHTQCPFHFHSSQFLVVFQPLSPLSEISYCGVYGLLASSFSSSVVCLPPPCSLSSGCQEVYRPTQTLLVGLWGLLSCSHSLLTFSLSASHLYFYLCTKSNFICKKAKSESYKFSPRAQI